MRVGQPPGGFHGTMGWQPLCSQKHSGGGGWHPQNSPTLRPGEQHGAPRCAAPREQCSALSCTPGSDALLHAATRCTAPQEECTVLSCTPEALHCPELHPRSDALHPGVRRPALHRATLHPEGGGTAPRGAVRCPELHPRERSALLLRAAPWGAIQHPREHSTAQHSTALHAWQRCPALHCAAAHHTAPRGAMRCPALRCAAPWGAAVHCKATLQAN